MIAYKMETTIEKICPKCQTVNPLAANFCRQCRYEFSEASKKGKSLSPHIKLFRIKEPAYTIGSVIHIDIVVENATRVILNGVDVNTPSIQEIVIEKVATIILTAENDYDIVSQKLLINPNPLPTIAFFQSTSTCVREGADVQLKWKVMGTSKVELLSSKSNSVVQPIGSTLVSPRKTEIYQLRCYAMGDSKIYVEQNITIHIIQPIQIDSFTTDKEVLVESEKATLQWIVKNATSIELLPLQSDVTRLHRLQVYPTHTTEYRLIAQNEVSRQEASVTIAVYELPKLDIQSTNNIANLQLPSCQIKLPYFKQKHQFHTPKVSSIDFQKLWHKITISFDSIKTKHLSFPRIINKLIK